MKSKIILAVLALMPGLGMQGALHIDVKKDKYGFVDDNGTVVIKHQYQQVTPFVDGRSKVQKGGKWGYIDETNKPVIPIQFDEFNEFDDKGIARVKKGKKYGYIRKDGTFLIKPEWDFIGKINAEGYVWVGKGQSLAYAAKGLYRDGVEVLKPKYRDFGFYQKTDSADYSDGHIFTAMAATEIKGNFTELSHNELPYIWVDQAYQRGIVDMQGNEVVKFMSYAMSAPSDGMVVLRQYNSGKKTYAYNYMPLIPKSKKLLKKDITLSADDKQGCFSFRNGMAINYDGKDAYLIDKSGRQVSGLYQNIEPVGTDGFIIKQNNRYGLINGGGAPILPCEYDGICAPIGQDKVFAAKKSDTGKCGFVDINGREVVPFKYESAYGYLHNRAYVKTATGWGIVNANQVFEVQPVWKNMLETRFEAENIVWVQDPADDKWKCLDIKTGKTVFGFGFDGVSHFSDKGVALVKSGDSFGYVNNKGAVVVPTCFDNGNVAQQALEYLAKIQKPTMGQTEAFRFNIYRNPKLHTFKLNEKVANNMWDF